MTNEELKKKIVDILVNCKSQECAVEYCATCEGNPYIEHCREKEQADTLIAAGLRFGENFTATFDHTALEREHELERCLANVEYWKSVYDLALNIAFTGEERAYYLKRAEEKLKEGSRKDEQTCKIFAVGGKSDT